MLARLPRTTAWDLKHRQSVFMKSGGRSRYEARCAGTAGNARIKVSAGHVGWADVIFCM
ncbi:MAG: hypothetical protein RLZZ15_4023, partial [Verrucomicrobiota bacterium]